MLNSTACILKNLVNFDTTSSSSNMPLIDYVCNYLTPFKNVDIVVIDNGCSPSDPDSGILKSSLLVRIGPKEQGGIMLSAHTDCVPVHANEWQTPPFTLTNKDGLLYGRGTTDMKSFIACALAQVPTWSKSNLQKPIYLALSYDEEVGCKGVDEMLTVIKAFDISPDLCIVGEPTEMAIAFAHKTRADIYLTFQATGGHASKVMDKEITCANTICSRLVSHMEENWKTISKDLHGDSQVTLPSFAITGWNSPATHNVIAARTSAHMDFRGAPNVPEEKIEEVFRYHANTVLANLRREKNGLASIDVQVRMNNKGFYCLEQKALGLAQKIAGTNKLVTVDYVCEAAKFSEAGINTTVVCGPGSIMQAHKPNEFIAASELDACLNMMQKIHSFALKPEDFSLA